jgi:hypothetical protein
MEAEIIFSKINKTDFNSMMKIFIIFKVWKEINFDKIYKNKEYNNFENKTIENSLEIIDILGEKYNTKFWHPTKEEIKEISEFYKSVSKLSGKERLEKIKIFEKTHNRPWDYDSWIDAILGMEVILLDLIECENNCKIKLSQLSSPCGGIEAIENFVKIYDGKIIENSMF